MKSFKTGSKWQFVLRTVLCKSDPFKNKDVYLAYPVNQAGSLTTIFCQHCTALAVIRYLKVHNLYPFYIWGMKRIAINYGTDRQHFLHFRCTCPSKIIIVFKLFFNCRFVITVQHGFLIIQRVNWREVHLAEWSHRLCLI